MKAGEQRDALLKMAKTWDELAQERERLAGVQRGGVAEDSEDAALTAAPPPSR
jgi:hypothetical protein